MKPILKEHSHPIVFLQDLYVFMKISFTMKIQENSDKMQLHNKIAILFQKSFQPIVNNLMIQLHRRNNFIVENIGPENIIGDQY